LKDCGVWGNPDMDINTPSQSSLPVDATQCYDISRDSKSVPSGKCGPLVTGRAGHKFFRDRELKETGTGTATATATETGTRTGKGTGTGTGDNRDRDRDREDREDRQDRVRERERDRDRDGLGKMGALHARY
jgi:hypothetical protein